MKSYCIIIFLSITFCCQSQFLEEERELNKIGADLLSLEVDDLIKWEKLSTFNSNLLALLDNDLTNNYKFDSLKTTMVLFSPDKLLRIFSFNFCLKDKPCVPYAILQYRTHVKENFKSSLLIPFSELDLEENKIYNRDIWYGVLYYNLIQTKYKKKKYYTLLGYEESKKENGVKRKIIDVITINKNDSIQFGAPIFETGSSIQNRIIFQYSTDVAMSLNYAKKKKMIIYDHLSPKTANLEGFYNTYGPDFSYCGLKFSKGIWKYFQDVLPENN